MSKRISAKYKISRRVGENLWGRGKDPYDKKNYPPGQHGPTKRTRVRSDYGRQLMAKQKLRGYYNIREKQFRILFSLANKRKGDTSENLIGLLESRLDAAIFRTSLVPTIFAARQFVSHKHVLVNDKVVNIPSYSLKPGDVIKIKPKSQTIPLVMDAAEHPEQTIPEYFNVDSANFTATYVRVPKLDEVPYSVIMEPNLVIEFYSR